MSYVRLVLLEQFQSLCGVHPFIRWIKAMHIFLCLVNGRNESEEGLLFAGSETGQKAQLLGTAGAQKQPYFGAPVAGNTLDAYARAPPSAYATDR